MSSLAQQSESFSRLKLRNHLHWCCWMSTVLTPRAFSVEQTKWMAADRYSHDCLYIVREDPGVSLSVFSVIYPSERRDRHKEKEIFRCVRRPPSSARPCEAKTDLHTLLLAASFILQTRLGQEERS